MPLTRLSERELLVLARNSQQQRRNLEAVWQAAESALRVADRGWRSQAFEGFKASWERDRDKLSALVQQLANWERQCTQHARVASCLNQPRP